MKFCTNCGNQMEDNVYTCSACGCGPKAVEPPTQRPARQLTCNRGALKAILLTIITFGIYGLVLYGNMSSELNMTASKYDGKKTMNYYLLFFIVGPITFEIATIVWYHKFSKRIGNELKRRGINYSFGAGSFWLWHTLGLLIAVGPLVYLHKVTKAINLINSNYNEVG